MTITGCATTRINNEWRDTAQPAPALKGDRVLVVCRALEETARRVCEEEWARQLEAAGAQPVVSFSLPGFPLNAGDLSAELRDAAVKVRAVAIASTTIQTAGGTTSWGYGPQVGVGVGGVGGSGGGGFGFGGVSISVPMGGGVSAGPSLGYSTSLMDVGSGRLVWSANATAASSGDQRGQLADLTRVMMEAMRKGGLI